MIPQKIPACAARWAACCYATLAVLGAAAPNLPAQTAPSITIRILDGKTGEPISPSNFILRFNHRDEPDNTGLVFNGGEVATATLPANATVISVEGSYGSNTTEVYINCDSDTARDPGVTQWYSIADILKSGMVTPNHCYKDKYEHRFSIAPKPGEFVFYVRTHNWHEIIAQ